MAAELPWCLQKKWVRERTFMRVVVTFLFQTNMRQNAIFVLAIEIIGFLVYLVLVKERRSAEVRYFNFHGGFAYRLFAQSFALISFGLSQAYIAKLQERVSWQMQEKEDLLDSVQEGVVVVSNVPSQNTAVDKKERKLLFQNEPAAEILLDHTNQEQSASDSNDSESSVHK